MTQDEAQQLEQRIRREHPDFEDYGGTGVVCIGYGRSHKQDRYAVAYRQRRWDSVREWETGISEPSSPDDIR